MKKKKLLVYDNQRYFSRLLNYEFKEDFDFDVCRNFDYFKSDVLEDYSLIIFVIYLEEELFDFMKVYKNGIPLIVCTFNNKILKNMQKIDDIILLDTSRLRSELITDMKYYFNISISQHTDNFKIEEKL